MRGFFVFLFFLFFFVLLFRATPSAYGSSQARGQIRATAASLHHSHSNTGSKLGLWPTPQLTAMSDPWPTEWGQRSNLHPQGILVGFVNAYHNGNSKRWVWKERFVYWIGFSNEAIKSQQDRFHHCLKVVWNAKRMQNSARMVNQSTSVGV